MEYPHIEKFLECKLSKKDIDSLKQHCIDKISMKVFMRLSKEFNNVSIKKEKELGDYFALFSLVLIDAFLRMDPPMLKESISDYDQFKEKEKERDNGAILFNLLIIMLKEYPEIDYNFLIN